MKCPICKEFTKIRLLYVFATARVYYCDTCTGVFNIILTDTDYLYDEAYFCNNYLTIVQQQIQFSKYLLQLISEYKTIGSILDVGCGTGIFLQEAAKCGFTDNVGVDISNYAIAQAQRNVTNTAQIINMNNNKLPDREFDIIVYLDSIAHIPNVDQQLEKLVHHYMHQDGILIIKTPEFSPHILKYVRFLFYFIPRQYLASLFFIKHRRLLFNEKSIALFLKRHSLEPIKTETCSEYRRRIRISSLKSWVGYFIFYKIPQWLNFNNSMIIVAKRLAKW